MAQENKQQQQQQQPTCPGNCLRCIPAQRQYCASQHAYSNMKVLDRVMETLASMQQKIEAVEQTVSGLAARIEAIQSGEATVFDPAGAEAVGDPGLFPRMHGEPEEKAE